MDDRGRRWSDCGMCGAATMIGQAMPVEVWCSSCMGWRMIIPLVAMELRGMGRGPNLMSIRAAGHHYTVDPDREHGPVMTIRMHDGTVIVTQRLRTQGQIPKRFLKVMPDNAVILDGNPQDLPMGVHPPVMYRE